MFSLTPKFSIKDNAKISNFQHQAGMKETQNVPFLTKEDDTDRHTAFSMNQKTGKGFPFLH